MQRFLKISGVLWLFLFGFANIATQAATVKDTTGIQYPSGNARMDILYSAGRDYPKKGLGSINGDEYKFSKDKFWKGLIPYCVGNFLQGVQEGYWYDERTSFERILGVSPDHPFFGRRSWDTGMDTAWERNFGVIDINHSLKYAGDNLAYVGAYNLGFYGAKHNTRRVHGFWDWGIAQLSGAVWQSAGLFLIRNYKK